ncbi:MAG: tetratricopeptide repeat protein, partial [Duncaniella sp.]|nr:tetratricopeptide repeat protein [Duncaniella sp.]
MRYLISLIILAACGLFSRAESPLIQQADSAYTADNFKEAADTYLHVIATEGNSAALQYNLGNCYYRLGEMGKAILAYERALRFDPTFDDARTNLEFINSKITDRPGERGTFLGNALDSIANTARSNSWAWIGFACFVLTLLGVLAYLFSDIIVVRKIGFFGGLLTFFGCICFIFLAFRSATIATAENVAIITSPSTILSTSPRVPKDRT